MGIENVPVRWPAKGAERPKRGSRRGLPFTHNLDLTNGFLLCHS